MLFIIGNSRFSLPVLLLDAECLQLSLKCSILVGPESGFEEFGGVRGAFHPILP